MNETQETLVIILIVLLSIYLVLNIIFFVIAIRVALIVKRVSAKAEELADKAEAVGEYLQHAAAPMLLNKLFGSVTDSVFKRKSGPRRK